MDDLGLQTFQLAWFKDDVSGISAMNLFQRLAHAEPDSYQNNKTRAPSLPFLAQASGSSDETVRQVTVSAGRVDYHVLHADRPMSGPWAWKLKEGLAVAERELNGAKKECGYIGSVARIAVVLGLIRNVTSLAEANRIVSDRTGVPLTAKNSDSEITTNLRKRLPNGLVVNRLLKFGTPIIQEISFNIGAGGATTPRPAGPPRYLAAFQIDVNTVPEEGPFLPEAVPDMFAAMLAEATELAQRGTLGALVVE